MTLWFQVRFDEQGLYRSAQPPGGEAWDDFVAWGDIARVCLEMEGFLGSDRMHIFTTQRPESYPVPLEAEGASELIGELVRRTILDGKVAIEAASGEGVFCWPE